jgi:hypothetical protein
MISYLVRFVKAASQPSNLQILLPQEDLMSKINIVVSFDSYMGRDVQNELSKVFRDFKIGTNETAHGVESYLLSTNGNSFKYSRNMLRDAKNCNLALFYDVYEKRDVLGCLFMDTLCIQYAKDNPECIVIYCIRPLEGQALPNAVREAQKECPNFHVLECTDPISAADGTALIVQNIDLKRFHDYMDQKDPQWQQANG